MNLIAMSISFSLLGSIYMSNPTLTDIRSAYIDACNSGVCDAFFGYTNNVNDVSTPEVDGYKSMVLFLEAKESHNPFKKYKLFSQGRESLELLINRYPSNIELRYLRLGIQRNSPSFLGYNSHIKLDEEFLNDHIHHLKDNHLKKLVINLLKST